MKQTIVLMATLLFSLQMIGQSSLDSGLIKMEITDVSSEDEMVAAQLDMMKGTYTIYAFTPSRTYSKSDMMGGMIQMTSVTDIQSQSTDMYMDMMGNKMLIPSTKEQRDAMTNGQSPSWDITYDKSDTKEIVGYNCYKANVVMKDQPSTAFEVYVTEEINASNEMIQGMEAMNLQGFPLEYSMNLPQMTFKYTATEVLDKVDESLFEIDKSQYKEMTYEDFMKQMGGMAGGLGF